MSSLVPFLPSLICIVVAAVMALLDIGGWGWFLFVAVLAFGAAVEASR